MAKIPALVVFLIFNNLIIGQTLKNWDQVLLKHNVNGSLDYVGIKYDADWNALIEGEIPKYKELDQLDLADQINLYNIWVVEGIIKDGIPTSVQKNSSFFTRKIYKIGKARFSLNDWEKDIIFRRNKDPRLHFVLVCGAVSCPKLAAKSFSKSELNEQIDQVVASSLKDEQVFVLDGSKIHLSNIFNWYRSDFGTEADLASFLKKYRPDLPNDLDISSYLPYDWSLNVISQDALLDVNPSTNRYIVSSVIRQGTFEFKAFNAQYVQRVVGQNDSYFTTFFSGVYGLHPLLNVGFDLRYRFVQIDVDQFGPAGLFQNTTSNRSVVSTFGPKIRVAPIPNWKNFSIQSAYWFPLKTDLQGSSEFPFADWNGDTWWTQIWNDFTLSPRFSLFAEIDYLWEDIGAKSKGRINRMSTPVTIIPSFFPTKQSSVYILFNASPYWKPDIDYFFQSGIGGKYQFTRNFEIEALYTYFTSKYLHSVNGNAATFNMGIRLNIN